MLSDEIIRVVYEHGAFNPQTTTFVAGILAIYGLGLPGFVMIKALNPGFFAREDTKTPMRFTMRARWRSIAPLRSRSSPSSPSARHRHRARSRVGLADHGSVCS